MKNPALALIAAIMLSAFLSCATGGGGGRGGEALQGAIQQSAEAIAAGLAPGTRVALVAFDSESGVLSDFIMDQLARELFLRGMEVAERRNLEFVFSEMRFQMTGYVSDDTAMSVGHFLGADVVITGRLWDMGGTRRLAADAIRVETAARAGASSVEIPSNRALRNTIAALEGGAERAAFDPGTATPRTAGEFQDRGIMFLYRGENEIAALDFSEALRINPSFASAYLGRGRARFALGEHGLAIADFTEAIRLSPNFATAHVWRGIVHLHDEELDLAFADAINVIRLDHNSAYGFFLRGALHFARGDFGPALADLTEAIRLYPYEAEVHRMRGNVHIEIGDIDRAFADFSEAIRVNPYFLGALGARADIHIFRGDFALAAADLTEMIRIAHEMDLGILNADIGNLYFLRGETYINLEALDRAAADFARAIHLDPHHMDAHFYRGLILFEQGQYFQAAEYFYAVLWLDPYNEEAYGWLEYALYRDERAAAQAAQAAQAAAANAAFRRGYAHLGLRDPYEGFPPNLTPAQLNSAIADLNEAVRLNPSFAQAYRLRGWVHQSRGEYDRALADFNQAIRLAPAYAAAYVGRGGIYMIRREFDRALAELDHAIRLNPNAPFAHHWRGMAHYRRGAFDLAIADFTQAIRLDPNSVGFHWRGRVHYDRGAFDLAIADFTQVIRLDPNSAINYSWRGVAHYRRREFDRAIADFEAALRINADDFYRQWLAQARRRGR